MKCETNTTTVTTLLPFLRVDFSQMPRPYGSTDGQYCFTLIELKAHGEEHNRGMLWFSNAGDYNKKLAEMFEHAAKLIKREFS